MFLIFYTVNLYICVFITNYTFYRLYDAFMNQWIVRIYVCMHHRLSISYVQRILGATTHNRRDHVHRSSKQTYKHIDNCAYPWYIIRMVKSNVGTLSRIEAYFY